MKITELLLISHLDYESIIETDQGTNNFSLAVSLAPNIWEFMIANIMAHEQSSAYDSCQYQHALSYTF